MITYSKLGLNGRLGNQMFQFAAAKAAAINDDAIFAIPTENHSLTKWFQPQVKYYSLNSNSHLINKLSIYSETIFNYDTMFNNIKDNTDLIGYFQTEKYFSNISDQIRKDFMFIPSIFNKCKEKIDNIREQYSKKVVSLHIRRTDYINLQAYHTLCSLEYYKEAIKLFNDAIFLIFSDDINWCKSQFAGKQFIFVEDQSDGEDLCLMSLCDHNIIANSSFSWWGAWLNNNQSKQVIAPKQWFGDAYNYKNTVDIYCDGWLKL